MMKRRLTRGPVELPDLLGMGVLQELIQVVLGRGLVIVPPVPQENYCSARDWDGKDYLRIIPRVVW